MICKIKSGSIKNFGECFIEVEELLEGADYSVLFECVKFTYDGGDIFALDNLRQLHLEIDPLTIDGSVVKSSFADSQCSIRESLSYSMERLILNEEEREFIIKERERRFWGIVANLYPIPPLVIYKHIPEYGSYFGDYVMWGFCYIFLNKGEGLVLAGWGLD